MTSAVAKDTKNANPIVGIVSLIGIYDPKWLCFFRIRSFGLHQIDVIVGYNEDWRASLGQSPLDLEFWETC